MPIEFVQTGSASIRVHRNGVPLEGGHAQLHTALARAAREAHEGGVIEVVQEQRIRVTADVVGDDEDWVTVTVLDGGNAASTFSESFDGGSASST